jgi:hypothetical protein
VRPKLQTYRDLLRLLESLPAETLGRPALFRVRAGTFGRDGPDARFAAVDCQDDGTVALVGYTDLGDAAAQILEGLSEEKR